MRRVGLPRRGGSHSDRSPLLWAALIVISVVFIAVSGTPPARSAQQFGIQLLSPVRTVIERAGTAVRDAVETIATIERLRSENDRLGNELSGARQRLAELTQAARENALLRALLGLRASLGWDLVAVRVTSVPTSDVRWELGIDAGLDQGIRVGMPVVGPAPGGGALAGTVVEAGAEWAVVMLIVDPRSRVIGTDQQSSALGVVQGQPGGQLVMTQVARTDAVVVGDTLVTAGLEVEGVAASLYPRGLLIGEVTALEDDSNGLTRTVFVRPAIDPRDLQWLMVVTGGGPPS